MAVKMITAGCQASIWRATPDSPALRFPATLRGHPAITGVKTYGDTSSEALADVGCKHWLFNRQRADNDARDAGFKVAFNALNAPNPATHLHRHRHVCDDLLDHWEIAWLSFNSSVEIHHMQPGRPWSTQP